MVNKLWVIFVNVGSDHETRDVDRKDTREMKPQTERIFDPRERSGIGRFAVSGLIDRDHTELVLVSFQWVCVDELGALDRGPRDLHPARVVRRPGLDHVAHDG